MDAPSYSPVGVTGQIFPALGLGALALVLVIACSRTEDPVPHPAATATLDRSSSTDPGATPATPEPRAVPVADASPSPSETAPPPPAAGTATAPPAAPATPVPTPPAPPSPTLTTCHGIACIIESAPDAFEHATWAPGEHTDWPSGMFFLSAETGRTEGYRVRTDGSYVGDYYQSGPDGSWVFIGTRHGEADVTLLHDRQAGKSWQWPTDRLETVALSREHVLFEDRSGNYTLTNRSLEATARFSLHIGDTSEWDSRQGLVSPDGRVVALRLRGKEFSDSVHLIDVETVEHKLILPIVPRENHRIYVQIKPLGSGIGLAVTTTHVPDDPQSAPIEESRHFSWTGADLSPGSCPGRLSPDGRFVARQEGSPIWVQYLTPMLKPEQPWASVVIADATSCEPVVRVRSAYASQIFWEGRWLANSEGFVVGVRARPGTDGKDYMVVRVSPSPGLAYLPRPPLPGGGSAPVPAPAGDGRYFAYDFAGIYDARSDRWILAPSGPGNGPFSWDADGDELQLTFTYWGEGRAIWLLLQPRLEFPPLGEGAVFRVAGPDACHELHTTSQSGDVIACLPSGARLVFVGSVVAIDLYGAPLDSPWVRVRTDDGVVGWMSIDHIAWY